MADLINNLKNKSVEELEEALNAMTDSDNGGCIIDIDGTAYVIPSRVLLLIESLASENERLKDRGNGL